MKVLITGGAGFIGSHLADRLVARDDEVLVVDNFATARRDNVAASKRLEVVEMTIADGEAILGVVGQFKPDVVVHAAASYKDPGDWEEDARTNVSGTINVARAAEAAGVRRVVYFQTALCYGLKPARQPVPVDLELDPAASSYAITKTAGEHFLFLSALDVVSFRLANVYGPRNVSGPLPTFYQRLAADKACFAMDTRRDFLFIEDLVSVVLPAIDGGGRRGVYHVSSGSDVSILELFRATAKAMGLPADQPVEVKPRGDDDAPTILLDPTKTESDFDWQARVPLEEGVHKAVEYYRDHGVEETYTHLRSADPRQ